MQASPPPRSSASLELSSTSSLWPSQPTRFPQLKCRLAQETWDNPDPWLEPPPNPILSGLGIFKRRFRTEQSPSRDTPPFAECLTVFIPSPRHPSPHAPELQTSFSTGLSVKAALGQGTSLQSSAAPRQPSGRPGGKSG